MSIGASRGGLPIIAAVLVGVGIFAWLSYGFFAAPSGTVLGEKNKPNTLNNVVLVTTPVSARAATPGPVTTTLKASGTVKTASVQTGAKKATKPPSSAATSKPKPALKTTPKPTPKPAPKPTPKPKPVAQATTTQQAIVPSDKAPKVGQCPIFPSNNAWNTDISKLAVHSKSDDYIAKINNMGSRQTLHPDFGGKGRYGMPINIISGSVPTVPIHYFDYAEHSDPGPFPIPADARVQPGEDKHLVVLNKDTCMLYELFHAEKNADDSWDADSGALWDLRHNESRPWYWTSSNAAGTPIYPGVIKYSEVQSGAVNHAIRFTAPRTFNAFILPATHFAGKDDPSLPPMGLRVRLKADFDISDFPTDAKVILTAMKKYGMILTQNGSAWAFGGEQDPRWDDDQLRPLKKVPGSAFEVVYTGEPIGKPAKKK